jgi:ABC-type amino acid transport substrate-binding protein
MPVSRLRVLLALFALVLATACAGSGGNGGSPAPTSSGTRLTRIVDTGVLRVGMSGEQPPLNMTAKSGEIVGLEVALAKVLAAAIGVRAEIVRIPFPNLIDALESGEIDLIMSGMTITAQRNLRVVFVGPYFLSGQSLLSKNPALLSASLEALNDPKVRLSALRSSTSEAWVTRALPNATLTVTDSLDAGIQSVIAGEADALVADREICYFAMLRNREAGLATRAEPLTVEPIGIGLPPDDHQLANLLENYLGALEMQGALQRARDYWFEDESWVEDLK